MSTEEIEPADTSGLRYRYMHGLVGVDVVPALLDEIDSLRRRAEDAERGERYWKRDAEVLRAEKFHARRILAALIEPSRYVVEIDRDEAVKRGLVEP